MPIFNQVVSGGGSAPATKYGVNLDGWIGDININGNIRTDQAVGTLNMPTLSSIEGWAGKFSGSTGLVGVQNLSGATIIYEYGLQSCFEGTNITGLNLSAVTQIGISGLLNVCSGVTTLTSVDLSSLDFVDPYGLQGAFAGTGLTSLVLPISLFGLGNGDGSFWHLNEMCKNCSSLQSLSFPNTTPTSFSNILQWYEDSLGEQGEVYNAIADCMGSVVYGCSGVTVHFTQSIGAQIADEGHTAAEMATVLGGTNTTVLFDLTDPA